MAQFVTHIQPTLVEASSGHHPTLHHHKDHHKDHLFKDFGHHEKGHQKDDKDKHHKESPGHHDKHHKDHDKHHKDHEKGHHKESPGHHDKSHGKHDKGHHKESPGQHKDEKVNYHIVSPHHARTPHRDGASGHAHHAFYELSFDHHPHGHYADDNHKGQHNGSNHHNSQGHPQSHAQGHSQGHSQGHLQAHSSNTQGLSPGHTQNSIQGHSPHAVSPSHKPTPPQFIDLQPVQVENKAPSDGNTSFLRAARAGHLDKVLEHLASNIDINTSNANGLNALHLASKDGHVDVVSELLKRGAVVDSATKKGNTALHIASLAGQEEVVKLLVQHGAAVNVQSQNGFTPLYMAAQENHDSVVKYLLANGANQSLATEDGFTPLAVAMQQGHDKVVAVLLESDTRGKVRLPALHIAAKKDDVKAAKLLLENEHNPDVTSKSGFTPLHIASHYGNEAIANLLISKGADVNYAAKHNITPLHVAAKWGKGNMVALLLERGANIEARTRDGLTPLHCAARSGHEHVVDALLERGAPISSKTKNGLAPLHMAAQGEHVDAARILLYHRAPVDEVTVDYLTALHVAAHCGHVRVAKLLLDRQADANARALNGFTPLHIACKKNRIKVVELLLKHGASISATTESGLTPLHVASFMGCMNIVIYLLQHDANPDVPTVRGETPLHLAARANQTDIIRILLRNGAQVDARAREQQTPLHIAARLGNVDIVMLLLQHGAQVDTATKDMYTALHIAAKEGQDEVAAVLLDNGASLEATTKKGFTPLHLAAKYGHIKVAKLLLQKEARVDAQGKNGVTPLHVASHYDHQNVAMLLLDCGASPHAAAKNGHTPLHIAARKNQMDIASTLLEYGARADAESKAGFTPLHLASQAGHADMAALLLEHHADANHAAKNGLTPLHLCAQEDRVNVAQTLVKNGGAKINPVTAAGYTPLHVAAHFGHAPMTRFLLQQGADVKASTELGYTPLHQAAQQGHTHIVNTLLENGAQPDAVTHNGQTAHNIAQKLGYITVTETLKPVTTPAASPGAVTDEKYRVVAPEAMHETFMSDSEEEGGEDTLLGDQPYRYLTVDEMKSLGDDSLPIDVTRDERIDSNRTVGLESAPPSAPPPAADSPQPATYTEYTAARYMPDNVDIKHAANVGKLHWKNFLVSFLVDARGGAMRGCRHSGVRVVVPPRCAGAPTRVTCRYVKPQRTPHPPPLMEGEALASRILELGPVGAKFLGPVIIEVPHFAALRGKEREIVILRSDNGETWREHTLDASEDIVQEVLNDSFEAEDLSQLEDVSSGRITRILTHDFPQYFAVVSRVRQEVHAIGPEGGMVSSSVVPQVQAVFPQGALTKKIKVGLQAQPIDPELTAKLLGHGVAVSPVVTVEPRRRKFHKAITLSMPAPRARSQGMINQYSGSAPTLRLLCSITGGTTRAQWEDVTGSTPLTFVNDCVSFTTTVSARFWLMDCRNIGDATKMATELYREAIHVPFMAKFVVFAKRIDPLEARLRVFCMTDDREDKTLEQQEHFTEVAKSRDVEVLEGKPQYIEFAGNLVPVTKSGDQLQFSFRAFRENRLPFSVRVKDQHADTVGRCLFMREPKVAKGEPPQQPICVLNIVLPDNIVAESYAVTEPEILRKYGFIKHAGGLETYQRADLRLSDMSNLLGEDWVPLAAELGISPSEVNTIKMQCPNSAAQQAHSMLRLWQTQSGNKAQGNMLELALRRIGRDDVIPQCLNVETLDHRHDQLAFDSLKDELGSPRNASLRRNISLDNAYDEQDIMKDSESIESLVTERKDSYGGDQRLKNISERDETKYIAEEKVVQEDSGVDAEEIKKTVAERRQEIEKRLSSDREIPPSIQKTEIVQEISLIKRQSLKDDKLVKTEKTSPETVTKEEIVISKKDPEISPEKIITEEIISKKDPEKTTTTTIISEVTTETLDDKPEITTKTITQKSVTETVVTTALPKLPPTPRDPNELEQKLLAQKQKIDDFEQRTDGTLNTVTTIVSETRTKTVEEEPRRDSTLLEDVAHGLEKLETRTSKAPIQEIKSPVLSKTPPPSPAEFLVRERVAVTQEQSPARTASGPRELTDVTQQLPGEEIDIQDTAPTETGDETLSTTELTPKPKPRAIKHHDNQIEAISPMLDTTDSTIIQTSETLPPDNVLDSYSDRKKFWENMGKDQIDVKEKTKSFIESEETFIQPPIPKPRSSMLQTAHSFSGTTIQKSPQKAGSITSVDVPVEVDIIEQTIPGKVSQPLSEYMASFQHPGFVDDKSKVKDFITTEIQSSRDILESEEKTVKTKVSQIPVSVTRKTMFERSVSLPTDNLQDMSETGFSARKKYFEQQIRNDIVVDQLMTQVEEEPSPEHKAISRSDISTIDDITEKTSFSKSTSELPSDHSTLETEPKSEQKIIEKVLTVKDITQSFQSYSLQDGKDIEITESKHSTTVETEQSICPSTDLDDTIDISEQPTSITDHKLETITKPSDSLEVHVDKSEIEDSEKAIDIDQEISISYDDIPKKDITSEVKDEELEPKQVHKAVDFSEWRVLSPINIPEEHVPDTVWEVPVQSQPISSIEEIVYDIPIESQIIFEKEEDSSEQISSEKTTDSHTIDMIKDLREDPEQYHISKEDALNVANELIGDIEREIQKRCVQKTSSSDSEQGPDQELTQTEISDYLRQLAESKGLDEREVQLVESVLSRKQRELSLMSRTDTQTTSSMEITDEDLRCSGAETDISPGEAKIEEKSIKLDLSDIEKTLAEVQESLHAAQEELLETGIHKKPSPSEFQFKGISQERKFSDRIDESTSEELHSEQDFATFDEGKALSYKSDIDKKVSESKTGEVFGISKEDHIKEDGDEILKYSSVEKESLETKTKTDIKQTDIIDTSDNLAAVKRFSGSIFEDTSNEALETQLATEILSEGSRTQELESETLICTEKSAGDTFESEMSVQEVSEGRLKSISETESRWSEASNKEEINKKISQSEKTLTTDDGTTTTTSEFFEEIRVEKLSSSTTINKLQEEQTTFTVTSSTVSDDDVKSTLHKVYEESFSDYEKPDTEQESTKRDSSEESTKEESTKSPDEQLSSSSSGRRGDSDTTRVTDRHDVILRKTKPHRDLDTSSSSGGKLKTDRRSGVDAWSSSGESHYHSFEQDSGRSRPCSSDIEGMVFAGGSSEYDTAPDRSHLTTSAEFHTAVSSLSSRDSMKSLDSESSGHLASVEVSEASETLVPSAFELEGDILDEAATDVMDDEEAEFGYDLKEQYLVDTISQMTKKDRRELMSLKTEPSESIDISEEDFPIADMKSSAFQDGESSSKMKRSYEMTFQPEPRVIIDDSPQSETGVEMDDKYGSSIEDGSILSMSYSSTSDASAVRSVIEVTKIDPSKYSSTTSLEEVSKMSQETQVHGSQRFLERDSVQSNIPLHISSDDFESTSVTLMTSQVTDENNQTVSTQITSTQHNGPTQVDYVPDYDDVAEPKKRGHRRYESTSSFVPSMITSKIHTTYIKDIHKFEEDDSKHIEMTTKEVSSSEKKDIDEAEKIDDISDIIPDHGMHKYYRDDITDTSCDTELEIGDVRQDFDSSRPHSQISKSDSESQRAVSTGLSDEIADSELTELLKQCSSEAVTEDPIERPLSPEPAEVFEKDDSPSARIRASDKDLELEFSISQSRSPDSFKSECIDQSTIKQETRKSIEQVKFGTSSEKSSFEEAEAAFSMVPHISPVHQAKPIGTIIEDEDAEKHEFETKEKSDKEKSKSIAIQDQSPGNIPDIMVTQHMTPLVDRGFRYPDMELEEKEEAFKSTPQTPASISSKSSEETDQGREYILDECEDIIHEEPETEVYIDEKLMTESKSEVSVTGDEKTVYETDAKQPTSQTESPASDSFELLENPDITEDFVVIEEVAKEADEFDSEGKSVAIKQTKYIRKHDEEMEQYLVKSAPAKMTNIKYYPGEDEMGPFDFEDSPPTADNRSVGVKTTKMSSSSQEYSYEFDRDLEANKKWMEMQFQGDQAAILASGYGYEMEFERVPLEDIKEEETTDFDPSSRIGSMGSQKESGGSFSSVKDSFSSTPEYDVLAGRKFFARSGEHDDVSMSSLQEFENLEQAISLENKRHHHGSQDSISNGSFTRRYFTGRSGQGDDVSLSSLKEFEGLESACIQAHKTEVKAKEEEELLAQIDEGQENTVSESGSCEMVLTTDKKLTLESDEDDYEKRMFEIDEIIRQAQSNVERFIDLAEHADKTPSLGRGDSLEEVAKVPDLDLDTTCSKISTVSTNLDDLMLTSTDSLDSKRPMFHASTDSLEMKTTAADLMTTSMDSIELQSQQRAHSRDIMTDSIEMQQDRSLVASDSLDLATGTNTNFGALSDSIDEDGSRIGEILYQDRSSSSGRDGDLSSASKEDVAGGLNAHLMLGSTDSLEPTSSTATHATYQYETDSALSSSFTSGGSNTMVSSTDTIDPQASGLPPVDLAAAIRQVWSDDNSSSGEGATAGSSRHDFSRPYVTEVIEPCEDDPEFSHTIHRTVELPAEVQKVTFRGPDAEAQMLRYISDFKEGEDVQETEELDADGNVHVTRVIQKRIIVKSDDDKLDSTLSGSELETYLQSMTTSAEEVYGTPKYEVIPTNVAGERGTATHSETITHRTYVTRHVTPVHVDTKGEGWDQAQSSTVAQEDAAVSSARRVEIEEGVGSSTAFQTSQDQRDFPVNQQSLSEEMKELLKELEEQSHK